MNPFFLSLMKSRLLLASLISLLAFAPLIRAQAGMPATPAAPAAPNPAEAEIKDLFGRMSARIKAGQRTEEALAPELKEMDALIAKYRASQPEDAAMITLMKAGLYLQVFEDPAKSVVLLKRIKTDYPTSKPAGRVDEIVASLEARIQAETRLAIGMVFPTITEKDLDGQPLDLAAYKGKVVLIDFWATWCGPCVQELPNVIAAYGKYHNKGFEIVGVSLDRERDTLLAFLKENKMTWPQYFDGLGWKNKVAATDGIQAIPATFLLDGEGRIIAKDLRGGALDQKLATLLAH
jgi:thiol-disulfide isomerase/thioredoxin